MKRGPPYKLSEKTIQALLTECRQADNEKNSKTLDACKDIINKAAAKDYEKRCYNINTYKPMGDQTMRKYLKIIFPESVQTSTTQTERRYEALMSPVNHLSLAALWPLVTMKQDEELNWVEDKELDEENIVNFDNTAILLHSQKSENYSIRMCAGTKKELKQKKISVGTTSSKQQNQFKERCAQLTAATTSGGSVNCIVVKIRDRRFAKIAIQELTTVRALGYPIYLMRIPHVEKNTYCSTSNNGSSSSNNNNNLGSSHVSYPNGNTSRSEGVSYNSLHEEDIVDDYNYDDIADEDDDMIIEDDNEHEHDSWTRSQRSVIDEKSALKVFQAVMDSSLKALETNIRYIMENGMRNNLRETKESQQSNTSSSITPYASQIENTTPKPEDVRAEAVKQRLVVTLDGETFQIRAINKMNKHCKDSGFENVEFLKFLAACSFIFQPNDVMGSFRELKRQARSHGNTAAPIYSMPKYMKDPFVTETLNTLDPASRRTFREFLIQLPDFLSSAFKISTIRHGWESPGLVPYSPLKMLCRWPRFKYIDSESSKTMLSNVSELSNIALEGRGFISSNNILKWAENYLPSTKYTMPSEREIEDYSINRWAATWLNSDGTVQRQQINLEAKKQAKENKREAALAKQQTKERKRVALDIEFQKRALVADRRAAIEMAGGDVSPVRKRKSKCNRCYTKEDVLI